MNGFGDDLLRHSKGRRPSLGEGARTILGNYGLQALAAYRLGRFLLAAGRRPHLWPVLPFGWPVYVVLATYVRLAFDIHLHLSADIGPAFYIGHLGGIVVERCRFGRGCSIGQSSEFRPDGSGPGPDVGDGVWIGAHAKIVGPWRIGSRSTIGAAAVVGRDIPERTLCLGNPARVIMRDYDNSSIQV